MYLVVKVDIGKEENKPDVIKNFKEADKADDC